MRERCQQCGAKVRVMSRKTFRQEFGDCGGTMPPHIRLHDDVTSSWSVLCHTPTDARAGEPIILPPVIDWIFTGYWRMLDNFYPSLIKYKWREYATVEHAFQAAKTFDPVEAETVRRARTPADAKALGQAVTLRHDWNHVRVPIMLNLVRLKFRTHPDLARKLLETGNVEIIEGNTWNDRVWGVCNGSGMNYLGKILMQVRGELRGMRVLRDDLLPPAAEFLARESARQVIEDGDAHGSAG